MLRLFASCVLLLRMALILASLHVPDGGLSSSHTRFFNGNPRPVVIDELRLGTRTQAFPYYDHVSRRREHMLSGGSTVSSILRKWKQRLGSTL